MIATTSTIKTQLKVHFQAFPCFNSQTHIMAFCDVHTKILNMLTLKQYYVFTSKGEVYDAVWLFPF